MARFGASSLTEKDNTEERIRRLEERLNFLDLNLPSTYLQGRLRTDRTTAPASSTDVNYTDQLYDVILLESDEYVLINNSGTLAWRKITLATF
jgi:hypothetical protein